MRKQEGGGALIGFTSGYFAINDCHALLMLGTDFPYRPFYPEGVPVIQIDMRGEQIGRRVPVLADVRQAMGVGPPSR